MVRGVRGFACRALVIRSAATAYSKLCAGCCIVALRIEAGPSGAFAPGPPGGQPLSPPEGRVDRAPDGGLAATLARKEGLKVMSKAAQGAAGNIKFSSGVKTGRAFGPAPKNLNKRVSPTPHSSAQKAPKTRAIPAFPNSSQMSPSGPRTIKGSA